MSEIIWIIVSIVMGLALGLFFYGGLYWTVKKGLTAKHPGLIFSGSLFLRIAVTLWGFLWVSQGHISRILACLAGFLVIRGISLYYERGSHRKRMLQEGRE